MARYIDADALIEAIKNELWDWDTLDGITSTTVLKQTITDIQNAPTADVVEVVRCKDCKYAVDFDGRIGCEWHGFYSVAPDWFCADGGRREDDDRNG